MSFATRSAAAGSPSGEPRERLSRRQTPPEFPELVRGPAPQRRSPAGHRPACRPSCRRRGWFDRCSHSIPSVRRARKAMFRLVLGRHKREVDGLGHFSSPSEATRGSRRSAHGCCSSRARSGPRFENACTAPSGAATKEPEPRRSSFAADEELGLAVEHVEGVDVVVVAVRSGPTKPGSSSNSISGELFAPDLDRRDPRTFPRAVRLLRPEEDGVGSAAGRFRPARRCCRSLPARRDLAACADFLRSRRPACGS